MKVISYNFGKDYWDHDDSFSCVCNIKYQDDDGLIDWLCIDYWGRCGSLGISSVAKDCEVIGSWDLYGNYDVIDNKLMNMLFSSEIHNIFNEYVKRVDNDFNQLESTKEIEAYFYGV